MPNGNQPFAPFLQPAPWEQTWLGRLFEPKISPQAYAGLQEQVTPYAKGVLEEAGLPGRISPTQWKGMQGAQPPMPTPAPAPTPEPEVPSWIGAMEPPPFPANAPPAGYHWEYDSASMRYVAKPDPRTPAPTWYQREQIRLAEEEAARGAEVTPWQQEQVRLEEEERAGAQEQQEWQRQWQEQQAAQEAQQWQQQQQWQHQQFQQQMGWYQQQAQMQQQEAERQERARLSAQPMSWLQYASYTGETPAIQPWMQPLMGGTAGEAIPGITPESMAGMPALTQPSAQLWGRMGPTAQAQFAGYRQARTGVRPEETAFRMGAGAPPAGRAPSLRWT